MTPAERRAIEKEFERRRKTYEKQNGKKMFSPVSLLSQYDARYYMIFGERSNGKTYGALFESLLDYFDHGRPFAVVRRYHEDLLRRRAYRLMAPLVSDGWIELMSGGEWDGVYYNGGMWYAKKTLENGKEIKADAPFAYAYELTQQEHDKSSGDLPFENIVVDEIIARTYLPDEFVLLMNTLSTIIRNKDDVRIWLCGNSINPFGCPYWNEMGLTHAREMKPGAVEVYTYGQSDLRVCVHRTEPSGDKASSAVYFAFDNPKLSMITSGEWEIDLYPHIPHKIRPADIRFSFFIEYDKQLLQLNVIKKENAEYLTVHPKTTEIKSPERELVFCLEASPYRNRRQYINRPADKRGQAIWDLIRQGRVFFSDNMTGELYRNFMEASGAAI